MANKQIRQVKLHGKYRPTASEWFNSNHGRQVPWLNVSGVWLEQAGFNVGDRVEIAIENKVLTIKSIADGTDGN